MPYPTQLLRSRGTFGSPDTAHHLLQTLPPANESWGMPDGSETHVYLSFRQNDVGGGRLADNNTKADVVVVSWYGGGVDAVITGQVSVLDHPLYQPLTAFVPKGYSFWVYTGIVSNPTGGATALQIHWAPVVKPS